MKYFFVLKKRYNFNIIFGLNQYNNNYIKLSMAIINIQHSIRPLMNTITKLVNIILYLCNACWLKRSCQNKEILAKSFSVCIDKACLMKRFSTCRLRISTVPGHLNHDSNHDISNKNVTFAQ